MYPGLSWRHIVLLIIYQNIISSSFKFKKIAFTSSYPLNSQASETNEKIEPAIYRSDLYAVLNVSRTSTKREIRDAFMAIAITSHPDRNNSQEALELYRNASYAYKILGKEQSSRANYDYTLGAENFANALTEVGTDIVLPLAREVAVPLLNVTLRGISSLAKPFVRDLVEQSKTVFKVASNLNPQDEDITKKIFDAISKTRSDQNLRNLNENIEKADNKITEALEELENTVETELKLKEDIFKINSSIDEENNTYISLDMESIAYQNFLSESKSKESSLSLDLNNYVLERSSVKIKSDNLSNLIQTSMSQLRNLEDMIKAENKKLQELNSEKEIIDLMFNEISNKEEELRKEYISISGKTLELSKLFEESSKAKSVSAKKLDDSLRSLKRASEEFNRQKEYISILERRLRQLKLKKKTFEDLLNDNENND